MISPDTHLSVAPRTFKLVLSLAALVALAIIVIPVYVGNDAQPFGTEWFVGADTYMRMVRVQDWWQSGHWYDSFSQRSNWPNGEALHWTRPLDIMIMALAAPFWPFLGFEKALFISGVIVSPVASIFAMWVLVHGTRHLLDVRGQAILLVLFAFQPMTRFYFLAARPDHHSLILLAFTTTLAMLLRFAHNPVRNAHAPAWAGLATAFGIWVSIESLTTELFVLGALSLPWLITGDVRWLAGLRRFALGGFVALGVMLMIEQPPQAWLLSEEYDRLSTLHGVLMALIALGIEGMWRMRNRGPRTWTTRLGVACMAGLGAAIVMAILYPTFFKGPFGAAMDLRLDSLWLGKIQEFQPLWVAEWDTLIGAAHIIGPTVWLAVWAVKRNRTHRKNGPFDETMLILVLAGLLYFPLTLYQVRWGAYLGVTVAIAWAVILQNILDWHGGPVVKTANGEETPILRVPLFVSVALAHLLVAGVMSLARPEQAPSTSQACKWRDLAPILVSKNFGGGRPKTIFSHIHQGPEIMYRTPHRVIGTPYHRNTEGILDTYNALAATDENVMYEILAKRHVDFVVLCADSREERHFLKIEGDTFTKKITKGIAPPWLRKMPLPAHLQDYFRIYQFVPREG